MAGTPSKIRGVSEEVRMRVRFLASAAGVASAVLLMGDMSATAQVRFPPPLVATPAAWFQVDYDDMSTLRPSIVSDKFGLTSIHFWGHAVVTTLGGQPGTMPSPGPFQLIAGGSNTSGQNLAPALSACVTMATAARLSGGQHVVRVSVQPERPIVINGGIADAGGTTMAVQVSCAVDP
jgi:hypothetical protein